MNNDMNNKTIKNTVSKIMLIGIALAGVGALILSTHQGPGIGGDATIYIFSAKNLLAGKGLGLIEPDGGFRLIPYFPPFFSLVLSFFGLFGLDLVVTSRWINIILFGALIILVGFEMLRVSKSPFYAFTAALLVALSPLLIPVYSWSMSEPLAIFLGFLGLILLGRSFDNENNRLLFILSAISIGLSTLTRYSHVAFLFTGFLLILFKKQQLWARVKKAFVYAVIGIVPVMIWIIYDLTYTSTVSSRSWESLSGMAGRFVGFWPLFKDVVLFWLIPDSWIATPSYPAFANDLLVYGILLVLIVWMILIYIKRKKTRYSQDTNLYNLALLLLVLVVIYCAVILAVYVTTYPPITIGSRMFSPIHIAVLWLIVALIVLTKRYWRKNKVLNTLLSIGVIGFILWYGWRSELIVKQYFRLGLGYTSVSWQESDTVAAVKALPEGQPIVSNEQTALLFLTGRTVYPFKEIYFNEPVTEYSQYGEGELSADEGQTLFKMDGAPLVLFDSIYTQMGELYGEKTEERINNLTNGLYKAFRGADGTIYYYQEK